MCGTRRLLDLIRTKQSSKTKSLRCDQIPTKYKYYFEYILHPIYYSVLIRRLLRNSFANRFSKISIFIFFNYPFPNGKNTMEYFNFLPNVSVSVSGNQLNYNET